MDDESRLAVASARKAVDEAFHEKALRAASDALVGRGDEYVRARRALAGTHVPDKLTGDDADALTGEELARWSEVARLVQQAMDDELMALLTSDVLHPNHLRELHRSWRAAQES